MDYDDEFAGQGGSYILGADGKRKRMEEAAPAVVPAETITQPAAPAAPADSTDPTVKAEV